MQNFSDLISHLGYTVSYNPHKQNLPEESLHNFQEYAGNLESKSLRTPDEADFLAYESIRHNVSGIIFLKVSIASYHCIFQIMPTANCSPTLTKLSSMFFHMEDNLGIPN